MSQFTRQPYKSQQMKQTYRSKLPPAITQSRKVAICLDWNDNPTAGCPYLNCHYDHTCYRCIYTPGIIDKHHKAIYCPHKGKKSSAAFSIKCQSNTWLISQPNILDCFIYIVEQWLNNSSVYLIAKIDYCVYPLWLLNLYVCWYIIQIGTPVNSSHQTYDTCHYIQLHSVYEYILFPHTLPSTAQLCSSLLTDGDTDPVTNLQSHTTRIRDWMVHLSGISWYHLKPQPSPPQQSLHSGKNP